MKLTPYRKTILIIVNLLDLAEKGGMEPQDCGAIFQAMETCLVASAPDGDVEKAMQSVLDKITAIIKSTHWDLAEVERTMRR